MLRRLRFSFSPTTLHNCKYFSQNSHSKFSFEEIKQLPKVELHSHLDGCIRPKTIIELTEQYQCTLPGLKKGETLTIEELKNILLPPGGTKSLEDFLKAFAYTLPVLQNVNGVRRVLREMAEDYGKDGVVYLEVRFCPALHEENGCTSEEILRAVCEESAIISKEAREHGKLPLTRIIVCALRHLPISNSMEMAKLAVKIANEERNLPAIDRQLVGFDLAGDEKNYEMKLFKEAFDYVHNNSELGITIHAGEADGWQSVKQAIEYGHAIRIGHGTKLIENIDYVNQIASNINHPITIETCITSNIKTKAIHSIDEHPIRKYFDSGIRVVPCTDGSTMIGSDLSEEYDLIQNHFSFSKEEIMDLIRNGFEASFAPEAVKSIMLKEI